MTQPVRILPDLQAELQALRAENAKLKAAAQAKLHIKVSAAGAVSVYGLGRWPVTLYKGQWIRLLTIVDQIKAFIVEHDGELSQGKGE